VGTSFIVGTWVYINIYFYFIFMFIFAFVNCRLATNLIFNLLYFKTLKSLDHHWKTINEINYSMFTHALKVNLQMASA